MSHTLRQILKTMKLLIVDDYTDVRILLRNLFEDYFDEIIEASDGNIAVELYKKHLPDWVFMDIKMEYMDGITATKEIKRFDENAKIIVVTLYEDDQTKESVMNAGAYEIVSKSDLSKIGELIYDAL